MTPAEMLDRWTAKRDELRRLRANVDGAVLVESFIADIEKIVADPDEKPVSIRQAAKICGYSEDHIGRLVRDGKLANLGRKHSPRVLPSALPRRANRSLALSSREPYNPDADARSLRGRR